MCYFFYPSLPHQSTMASRSHLIFLLANIAGSLAGPAVSQNALASGVAVAAQTVAPESSAGTNLFDSEVIQLTADALEAANAALKEVDVLSLFGFDDSAAPGTGSRRLRRGGTCKKFPGDSDFPTPHVWSDLDLLLGGALIKTTPIGAPCYKSSDAHDVAKCEDILARFTTADLQ
jgi:hypothetical protein